MADDLATTIRRPMPPLSFRSLLRGGTAQDYPPTEQEEQDLRSQGLLGNTIGALQGIGNVLDTPGSIARGALWGLGTGDFSPVTEGFLDPSKRKYGSDFVDAMGWTAPENWTGSDIGETISNSAQKLAHGLLGFGIDVVTDPLSAVGILPKTSQGLAKAGEAARAYKEAALAAKAGDLSKLTEAQRAGQLGMGAATSPYHVAKEVGEGDRALVGLRMPFWLKPFGVDTETPLAAGNLGMGKDLAEKLMMGLGYNPATRLVRGAMSSSASPEVSRFEKGAQIVNDMKTVEFAKQKAAIQSMTPFFAGAQADLASKYEDIAQHFLNNGNQMGFQEFARRMQTDTAMQHANAVADELNKMVNRANPVDPAALGYFTSRMNHFRNSLREMQNNAWEAFKDVGGDRADLEDAYALHSARFSTAAWDATRANRQRFGPQRARQELGVPGRSGTIARNDAVRHIPTSEFLLNRLSQNRDFLGIGVSLEDLPEAVHEQRLSLLTGIQPTLPNGSANPLYNIADMQHEYVKGEINKALFDEWIDTATGQPKTMVDPATSQVVPLKRTINAGTPHEQSFTYANEQARWNQDRRFLNPATGKMELMDHPVDNLVHWLNGLPAKVVENGVYDQTLVKDAIDYVGDLAGRTATLKSAHDYLARPGIVGTAINHGVPLRDAWGQGWNPKTMSGLNPKGLEGFVESKYAQEVGAEEARRQQMLQQHPLYGQSSPQAKMQGEAQMHRDAVNAVIDSLQVHPRAVPGLNAYADVANNTGPNGFLRQVDDFNRSLKSWLYSAWPPGHIRDFLGHSWNAAADGKAGFTDIFGRSIKYGKHLTTGSPLDANLAEHMAEFEAHGGNELIHGPYQDLPAGTPMPGPKGFVGTLYPKEATWNPLRTPGGFGLSGIVPGLGGLSTQELETTAAAGGATKLFRPIQAGQDVQQISGKARLAGYFSALRDKDYTPAQAMSLVKASSYMGDKLSPFEKTILSRLVPFERFTTRNLPYQIAGLIKEPGGIRAQTLRALNESSSQNNPEVYTPEFMREEQAVPLGGTPESQSFWTNTIVPLNELNDVVIKRGRTLAETLAGSAGRTAEKFASKLHPALTVFPEQFADKQLFTGRKISDLQSPSGIPALDRIIHYTPASRLYGTAAETWDQRLTLAERAAKLAGNLTAFGHISTQDTARYKALDERDALERKVMSGGAVPWTNFMVPGAPTASRPYARPGSPAAAMTPQQLQAVHDLLKRRQGLIEWSKTHAEQMRQQRDAAPQPTL